MCHILVECPQEFPDKEKKKEFQEEVRIEIGKTKTNPIIQFVYGNSRRAKKQKQNYLKKHPRAVIKLCKAA